MLRFDNPLFWSIPLGRWRGTPIRLSLISLGALIPVCYHFGIVSGLLYGLCFIGMVIIHEASRLTVLSPNRTGRQSPVIVWPFGNLVAESAMVPVGKGFAECFAGYFSLLFCLLIGLATVSGDRTPSWQSLFRELPPLTSSDPVNSLGLMILAVAVKLSIIQFLPIHSTDMGRFLDYLLHTGWDDRTCRQFVLKMGLVTAFIVSVFGCVSQLWWLVPVAFVLIALTIAELSQQLDTREDREDETFLGYDFSAGYTSLENSATEVLRDPPPPVGMVGRWMAKNAQRKRLLEEEMARLIESELDRILSKVHERGVDSLTPHERLILNQASVKYRNRRKASSA